MKISNVLLSSLHRLRPGTGQWKRLGKTGKHEKSKMFVQHIAWNRHFRRVTRVPNSGKKGNKMNEKDQKKKEDKEKRRELLSQLAKNGRKAKIFDMRSHHHLSKPIHTFTTHVHYQSN